MTNFTKFALEIWEFQSAEAKREQINRRLKIKHKVSFEKKENCETREKEDDVKVLVEESSYIDTNEARGLDR